MMKQKGMVQIGLLMILMIMNVEFIIGAPSSIPTQVHLALTKNSREMIVSFHTEIYDENALGKAQVMYSKNENFQDYQVAHIGSVSTTYGDSAKTGYEHHVLLAGLEYSTKYYYKCGFKNSGIESEVFYFHTRTDPSATESKQVSVLMYGDQGTTKSAYVIARSKHFVKSFYDKSDSKHKNMFVYHLGDIGYANDYAGAQYQYIWNKYMNMLSVFMPYAPYMVCVGNHEKGPKYQPYDEFEIPFNAYNSRFYMPGRNDSDIGHNMWHVFEYGPITFVAMDTETNFPKAHFAKYDSHFHGNQMKWFEETLAKVDRKKTPWLIVVGHRPIYSSTHEFSNEVGEPIGEAKDLQDAFEELIYKYKTDIVMVGHVHSYERTYPVYKTKVESKSNYHNLRSPIHIVNGGGGNIEGQTKPETYYMNHDWTADIFYKDEGYGILRTSFDEKTKVSSLKFDYYESKTGSVVDTVTISKDQ